jgi:hypothetical protein
VEKGNPSGMRPESGDSFITLPITFDYNGGRRAVNKTKLLWAVIISVVTIIVSVGVLFGSNLPLLLRVCLAVGIFFIMSLIVRYVFLEEGKVKANYRNIDESNNELDEKVIWGIYEIESVYPYICRFRSGKSGVFISLNKDVILGKYAESEFEHFEAIGDAYNLAGAGKVQMIHIDYMDNVGSDERLEYSFSSLSNISNPDLKELLTEIFSHQQEQMMKTVTSFDVYAFMWTGSDISAWNTIQRILACFLDANYRSYHVLNSEDLRELVKVVFNLEEFSVSKASSKAFEITCSSSIVPIVHVDVNGVKTKLGKTREERQEEARRAEEDKRKRRQPKHHSSKPEEGSGVYDIF